MSETYFKNIESIGDLYLDNVLLEFEQEPILFVCRNDNDELFLCLCSEIRNMYRWLIANCNVETLVKLTNRKIDIYNAFKVDKPICIIELNVDGEEQCAFKQFDDIDPLDLPKPTTMLNYISEESLRYIESLKRFNGYSKSGVSNSFSECITNVNEEMVREFFDSTDKWEEADYVVNINTEHNILKLKKHMEVLSSCEFTGSDIINSLDIEMKDEMNYSLSDKQVFLIDAA